MKTALYHKEDYMGIAVLIGFAFVLLFYLLMIAWIIYEFLHSPEAPSTRIIYPITGVATLHPRVKFIKSKIFPR